MSGIDVIEARVRVTKARQALDAMRSELAAVSKEHPELKDDPHWQNACEQSRAVGLHMRGAKLSLESPPREEIDADESRDQVRETLWA